jgi:catechol 2,3-dioxygenase-like lactoylglutathione lyase family enzyme
MAIKSGVVHHVTITVTDVERSMAFYADILGFQKVADFGPRAIMHNGHVLLTLSPPPDPAQAIANDRFNENRVGMDHVSFAVESLADLEQAADFLDEQGVERGQITDLAPFGIYIMAFRDPDNVQLELTAPHATE